MSSILEDTKEVSFFTLSLNSFVCNNSTGFVKSIAMVEDVNDGTSTEAVMWSPSLSVEDASYPRDIEAIKQDIINTPGRGFEIYWEEHSTLNYPGHFIVVVNTESHPWFNPDASISAQTQAVGIGAAGASNVYC